MKFKNRVRKAFSSRSRDESLIQRDIAGTAVVNSVKRSLVSSGEGSDSEPIYKYELRVTVPGQEPYDVAHSETGRTKAGETVAVKVDPDDPENLVIDWGQVKAATTAKWTQVTQQNEARIQSMVAPTLASAGEVALEPIAGITLERYAELSAARVKQGIATQEQQDAWLETEGVEPAAYLEAANGWNQRIGSQPAISVEYAAAFQRASG